MSDIDELYLGRDLQDYADTSRLKDKRYYGRGDLIRDLLPDHAIVRVYSTGGYQGSMGFAVLLDDYVWLIKEYYGSCSYCDGLLGSTDTTEYGLSMLRNAYCIRDLNDAIVFTKMARESDSGYVGWDRISYGLVTELKELEEDQ